MLLVIKHHIIFGVCLTSNVKFIKVNWTKIKNIIKHLLGRWWRVTKTNLQNNVLEINFYYYTSQIMQEAWKKRISHGVPVYGIIQEYYEGSELTFWTVLYKMTLNNSDTFTWKDISLWLTVKTAKFKSKHLQTFCRNTIFFNFKHTRISLSSVNLS